MTNTQEIDIRDLLGTALVQGGEVLGGVRPDQFDLPTPCREMSVRQLMDHLVGVAGRIAMLGETGELGPAFPALDEWDGAYARSAEAGRKAWADPAALERTVRLPWAEMSGARTLAMYVSEVTVHTWDLATATGQSDVEWDPDVVAASLSSMETELPAQGREGAPFDPVVAVSPGAPAIDRLVAWTGRQP